MSLPKQVEEAAQMAEELHSQITGQQTEEVEQHEEAEQEDQPDVPHDDDVEELRKFKDKYLVLQGKYDAEVPRLHNELKEFKQSVFERLQQPIKQQEQTPAVDDRLAKFREEYGEDFVENIKELFRAEVDPLLKKTMEPVQKHVQSVEDTQVQAAQQNFANYLDSKVNGNWRDLWAGKDQKFVEFLQQPDPSGYYTYGDLAQMANDNWDADRLGKIFNDYLESSQPKQVKKQNPAQEAMVAPSRTTTHTTPSANDKRVWTQDMIAQFQTDDRRGKYDPDTSKAMWDDLLAAMAENRIR